MTTPDPDSAKPDTASDEPVETFSDAPDSLIAIWKQRRQRLKLSPRDWFPAVDVDLVGRRVHVWFDPVAEGIPLPRFRLDE